MTVGWLRDLLVRAVLNGFHDFSFVKRLLPVIFNTFFFFISHCRLKRANNLYLIQYGCSCKIAIHPVNSFISYPLLPTPSFNSPRFRDRLFSKQWVCVCFFRARRYLFFATKRKFFFFVFFSCAFCLILNCNSQGGRKSLSLASEEMAKKKKYIYKWSCSSTRRKKLFQNINCGMKIAVYVSITAHVSPFCALFLFTSFFGEGEINGGNKIRKNSTSDTVE